MAAMDIEKARALAEQMIRTGQNKGRSLEDLVRQIVTESAGAPQTATGAGLMIAPPPRTVTPATPAPMQPGVPLVAPKPTAQTTPQPEPQPQAEAPQRAAPRPSELRPVLEGTLARIGALQGEIRQAAANKQPPDIMAQVEMRALKDRAQQLQARVQAEEGASVPEELRSALEGRQARLARREELLAQDKSRSPWEALLAGGAAMAQGRRGENFGEALSRGLQTGLQEYGRSRRANEQGVEGVAEAREQAMIDRYTMQEKAREAAAARVASAQGMEREAIDAAVRDEEIPLRLRKGKAEVGTAEFNLQNAPAAAALERRIAEARIRDLDREDRGGGGKADVEGRQDRNELDKVAAEYEGARAAYNEALRQNGMKASAVPAEINSAYLSSRAKLESLSRTFARRYGSSPYIGAKPQRATSTAISADPLGLRR